MTVSQSMIATVIMYAGATGMVVCFSMMARQHRWHLRLPLPWLSITLTEAAELICRSANPATMAQLAADSSCVEHAKGSIVIAARNGIVTLTGRAGPTHPPAPIPRAALRTLSALEGDNLRAAISERPAYIDVRLRRADALEVLRRFEFDV